MLNANLNHDQQSAVTQLASFLASSNKHMIISGAGGTGKSYLMRYINGYWNDVKTRASIFSTNEVGDPVFTGTTNEAVNQLDIAEGTIYGLAGLYPRGKYLNAYKSPSYDSWVVFVDEASYIDEQAFKAITAQLPNCKFVWVMDQHQLAPVGSDIPYVTAQNFPLVELTIIERCAGPLPDLVRELREAVRNNVGVDLRKYHNGADIQVVDATEFQKQIIEEYRKDSSSCRVIAFKNATVDKYNNAIHEKVLGNPPFPHQDAIATINSYNEHHKLRVGKRIHLTEVTSAEVQTNSESIAAYYVRTPALGFWVPKDKKHLRNNNFLVDIALPYASTTHKAQGSTIPTVFVDAKDIFSTWDAGMRKRLLYVAISRASKRVVICL